MHSRCLLISINGVDETTGGGLYLKTIENYLSRKCASVVSIGKGSHSSSFNKTLFSDVVSRLLLSPTFLMFYIRRIFKQAGSFDIVAFHSGRCIPLALIVNVFKRRDVCIFLDNVEYKLSWKMRHGSGVINYCFRVFDSGLLIFHEKFLLKHIKYIYVITEELARQLDLDNYIVLPIKVHGIERTNQQKKSLIESRKQSLLQNAIKPKAIFVASFSHSPNIEAGKFIERLSLKYKSVDFILAGRNASEWFKSNENIHVNSNPSNRDLRELYENSFCFISPVFTGSGMKTKVAEAASHLMPVIGTSHSLIGYGRDKYSECIFEANTLNDFCQCLDLVKSKYHDISSDELLDMLECFEAAYVY